jgi:hypothetical protein
VKIEKEFANDIDRKVKNARCKSLELANKLIKVQSVLNKRRYKKKRKMKFKSNIYIPSVKRIMRKSIKTRAL